MKPGTARKVDLICMAAAVILAVLGCMIEGVTIACSVMAVAAVVGGLAVVLIFWRCPECGALLPLRGHIIEMDRTVFCPACGRKLEID